MSISRKILPTSNMSGFLKCFDGEPNLLPLSGQGVIIRVLTIALPLLSFRRFATAKVL